MEWISVKDKMPAIYSWVLVTRRDATPQTAIFIATENYYYFCIGSDTGQTWEPEYWIPLPNQPERSKREDHESGCGALNIVETQ